MLPFAERPITLPADDCGKCGQDHRGCGSHEPELDRFGDTTGFWRPCHRMPGSGDRMCSKHTVGNNTVYSKGREILARHHRPMGNVLEELKLLFEELTSVKDDLLASVEEDHLSDKQRIGFMRAVKQAAEVGAVIAKLNIDERLVAIEEGKARLMAAVVMRVLGSPDLGLTQEQLKVAQRQVASEMRALDKSKVHEAVSVPTALADRVPV